MALTLEELEWVHQLLAECEAQPHRLSPWERSFIADQQKRSEELKDELWMSGGQFRILRRIREKFNG